MRKTLVVALALILGLPAAWSCTETSPTPDKRPANQFTSSHPQEQPVVALWDAGIMMAGLKPFLLLAAWEDGTVIRRGDVAKPMGGAGSPHDWAARKLTIGSIKPSEVQALQAAIAKAGFFRPPMDYGLVFPDGPMQALVVRYGQAGRLLRHYGPSDKWLREYIGKLGPTSEPSRKDARAFVAMWDHVAKLIDAVAPKNMAEFRDQRKLAYPESFDATDENGDPVK